jgi:sister-chromatid-cohesion protein PDS5
VLQACSAADNSRVLEKAQRLAMDGTPKQAKYAARVLAYSKDADANCSDLVDVSRTSPIYKVST